MKIIRQVAVVIFIIAGFSMPAYANRDKGMNPAQGFFLPEGNAEAGKKAFAHLKCSSCHWVRNEIDLKEPVAEKTGPMLGPRQAKYSRGWIANSIVSPSHTVVYDSDGYAEGSDLSRMGDFTQVMTVREMIDIVAYIRSLDDSKR